MRPEVGVFECILTHLHFLCLAKSTTSKKKKDTTAKKVNFYFVLISFRGSSWTIPTTLILLFLFFPQSVPANKKKTEGKAAKKVTGEKKSKSQTSDKVVTAGADDSDSDSSLDVEKWKKLLQQMTGESLNALFMGERVKDEVMKRILEK